MGLQRECGIVLYLYLVGVCGFVCVYQEELEYVVGVSVQLFLCCVVFGLCCGVQSLGVQWMVDGEVGFYGECSDGVCGCVYV